jgi:tRNA modification GTPase
MRDILSRLAGVDDTIAAISSPFGRGAIGLIRISGPLAEKIVRDHVSSGAGLEHRRCFRRQWRDSSGSILDDVLVTFFRQPNSYTGENLVEIGAHGNPFVLEQILETIQESGARLAGPGEFTWRAVANGKIDLLQAEAIRDFVDAQTREQARVALSQMEGGLSRRVHPIKERLIDLIASFEAAVDFVEDDLEVLDVAGAGRVVEELAQKLGELSNTFGYGRLVHEGLRLVIVGKPNVGKSSLFNRILGADRAIVTEMPGTTRDVVTETITVQGVAFRLCDTAGIRESGDKIEGIGIERTIDAVTEADVVLVVLDGSAPLDDDDHRVLELVRSLPHLIAVNKSDLPERIVLPGGAAPKLRLSASTGAGIEDLEAAFSGVLRERVGSNITPEAGLTNARQRDAVVGAIGALNQARDAMMQSVPPEMVLMDLYGGLSHLNTLTGEVLTEDILDRVFSKFCVGK